MSPLFLICWILLIWGLGWLAFPLSVRIWGRESCSLPDGGLAAGRMLFLTLWTLITFWAGNIGLPVRWAWLWLLLLATVSFVLFRRSEIDLNEFTESRRRAILSSEAVFLGVFLLFLAWRGYWPDIANGEKPMDMALIGSCARADYLPPANPYAANVRLAGYYYFGHLETAVLTDTIGSSPRWTYNLMCATLPALCFSILFSLASGVTGRLRNGLAAAVSVLALGTLQPLLQWMQAYLETAKELRVGSQMAPSTGKVLSATMPHLWPLNYVDTSRVIPNAINEYPWFTFNFADLHAHYFAMPLALLVLCLAYALYSYRSNVPRYLVVLTAASLGALIVTNTWDYPAYTLLVLLSVLVAVFARSNLLKREDLQTEEDFDPGSSRKHLFMKNAAVVVLGSLLLALPYLLNLRSAAHPPAWLEQPASPPVPWLLMWFIPTLAWLLVLLRGSTLRQNTISKTLIMLFLSLAVITGVCGFVFLYKNYFVLLFIITLLFCTIVVTIDTADPVQRWLCCVATCGLLSLLWSETTWAGFLGPPFHRQDTVFKFGLQAWYLLGTAAACGAWREARQDSRPRAFAWQRWPIPLKWGFVPLLLVALVASVSVVYGRTRNFEKFIGWDTWGYLSPNEQAAADWLQHQARDGDNLIEAIDLKGGDYDFSINCFTHATGVPALVGPSAHSFQWSPARSGKADKEWGAVDLRRYAVSSFYNSSIGVLREEVIRRFGIRFIVIGAKERELYDSKNLNTIDRNYRIGIRATDPEDAEHAVIIYEAR